MVSINEGRSRLNLIEEIWMIADLLELHEDIEQFNLISDPIDYVHVALKYIFVQLLLQFGQTDEQVDFFFQREILLHVHFQTTQHEWPQQTMDLLYYVLLGFLLCRLIFALYVK